MQVADKHQLRIARDTIKMSESGALIMGGMTRREAIETIARLAPRDLPEYEALAAFDCPNLDGMALDELHEFCQGTAPELLRAYAAIKARAMQDRTSGRIQNALLWEQAAERIYKALPADVKW